MNLLIPECLLSRQWKRHRTNDLQFTIQSQMIAPFPVPTWPIHWHKRDQVTVVIKPALPEDAREFVLGGWAYTDRPWLVWCSWLTDTSSGCPESSLLKIFATSCTQKMPCPCCPCRADVREPCSTLGLLHPGGWGNMIAILITVCKGFTVPFTMCSVAHWILPSTSFVVSK